MDWLAFKDWALLGLLGGGLFLLIDILREIKNSIILLNSQIAVVIEKTNNHEMRISNLEEKKDE